MAHSQRCGWHLPVRSRLNLAFESGNLSRVIMITTCFISSSTPQHQHHHSLRLRPRHRSGCHIVLLSAPIYYRRLHVPNAQALASWRQRQLISSSETVLTSAQTSNFTTWTPQAAYKNNILPDAFVYPQARLRSFQIILSRSAHHHSEPPGITTKCQSNFSSM